MARTIHTSVEINAPADRVWDILINFEDYPNWNPFITKIQGEAGEGANLEVFISPPGGKGMTFKPRVIKCEPNKEFRWKGKLFVPGLFDGEHSFQINPIGDDRVDFVQEETFSGILVGLVFGMMGASTQKGFEAMNQALKTQAEGGTSG